MLLSSSLFLFFASVAFGQESPDTSRCLCEDQGSGATWVGSDEDFCSGCDQVVRRRCQISPNAIIMCQVTLNCSVSSCTDTWAPWANLGPCDNACGRGEQKQIKICYQANSTTRGRRCQGGFGKNEKSRNHVCTSQRGCTTPTILMTTLMKTRKTTQTVSTSTRASTKVEVSSTSSVITTTTDSSSGEIVDGTPTFLLPVVLGCALVVCLTVLIIIAVLYRNRLRQKDQNNSIIQQQHNGHLENNNKTMNHLYEEVGPHHFPMEKSKANRNSSKATSVKNILYSTVDYDNASRYQPPSRTARPEEGTYLEPNSSSLDPVEVIYYNDADTESSYVTLDQATNGSV